MPVTPKLSPWQAHVVHWSSCTSCPLHATRSKVVLARGKLPCDVLFVGEAPGRGEDTLGQPFVGPAGHLLDRIVKEALLSVQLCSICHKIKTGDGRDLICKGAKWREVRYAFTNLIACIPIGDDGEKTSEPPEDSIEACSPRLVELVTTIAKPRLIVKVGRHADDWLTPGFRYSIPVGDAPQVKITHPAAIMRMPQVQAGLEAQRTIVTIRNACRKHLV